MINWLFSLFQKKNWVVEVEYTDGSKQIIHPYENTKDAANLYAWIFQQEEYQLLDTHDEWCEIKYVKTTSVKSINRSTKSA